MYNNPYWAPATTPMLGTFPYMTPLVPTPQPPQQSPPPPQPQPQQQVQTSTMWNWKAVTNYQAMLMESVPFDGSPVLFMVQNEPIFYVVRMEEGKKMINGFKFDPLDNPEVPPVPVDPVEQRLSGLENNMNSIMTQLQKLVEVSNHESINDNIKTQVPKRQPITTDD